MPRTVSTSWARDIGPRFRSWKLSGRRPNGSRWVDQVSATTGRGFNYFWKYVGLVLLSWFSIHLSLYVNLSMSVCSTVFVCLFRCLCRSVHISLYVYLFVYLPLSVHEAVSLYHTKLTETCTVYRHPLRVWSFNNITERYFVSFYCYGSSQHDRFFKVFGFDMEEQLKSALWGRWPSFLSLVEIWCS